MLGDRLERYQVFGPEQDVSVGEEAGVDFVVPGIGCARYALVESRRGVFTLCAAPWAEVYIERVNEERGSSIESLLEYTGTPTRTRIRFERGMRAIVVVGELSFYISVERAVPTPRRLAYAIVAWHAWLAASFALHAIYLSAGLYFWPLPEPSALLPEIDYQTASWFVRISDGLARPAARQSRRAPDIAQHASGRGYPPMQLSVVEQAAVLSLTPPPWRDFSRCSASEHEQLAIRWGSDRADQECGYDDFTLETVADMDQSAWSLVPYVRMTLRTTTAGSLTPNVVQTFTEARMAELRFCYENLSAQAPRHGTTRASVTLEPAGTVSEISTRHGNRRDETLTPCIERTVRRWTFPPAPSATRASLTFTFRTNRQYFSILSR
ncbi:MAG: AgmX/PglI C-terminal domain-containing protein [Sandaracinaceae bacterium]|nr:AgmX/PglI C-terminal domain-containing protein [Sandaracinaceae bacterium]